MDGRREYGGCRAVETRYCACRSGSTSAFDQTGFASRRQCWGTWDGCAAARAFDLDHNNKWVSSGISHCRLPINIGYRARLARAVELETAPRSCFFGCHTQGVTVPKSGRHRCRRCVSTTPGQARHLRHLINNWGGPGSAQGRVRRGGGGAPLGRRLLTSGTRPPCGWRSDHRRDARGPRGSTPCRGGAR